MKLLITGAYNCGNEQLNKIRNLGHDVIFMQQENGELPCAAESIEGVICNGLFLHHDIEKFKALKYIQLTSAGFDRVPMDYVNTHGIEIYNARGVYSVPMAEFAISGVLQLYKQSKFFYNNQINRKWEKSRSLLELNGKTALIVGCGSVGNEVAKRLTAFNVKVFGVDLFTRKDDLYSEIYPLEQLKEVLPRFDIIVLTLPLTDKTKGMFDKECFDLMKDSGVLVNIARGAVVDEKSMIDALDSKLLGAVLDVFEEEPLSQLSPLWEKENVILTPHNSFVGDGNIERLNVLVLRNLSEYDK